MLRTNGDGTPLSYMAMHGPRLLEAGYSLVPIACRSKKPSEKKRRGWSPMPGWSRYCEHPPTESEVELWSSWPGCGIGIPCGPVAAVDIDILDGDAAIRTEQQAYEMLGRTPALRIGQNPKRLLVYRAAEPFTKIGAGPIEILAHGQQFVAYGLHVGTGEPYRWPIDELWECPLAGLPVVTQEQCQGFLDEALKRLPPELRGFTPETRLPKPCSAAHSNDPRGTVPAVQAALDFIGNPDCDWDTWTRIGLATKAALGDAGWPLFEEWSARSTKNAEKATAKAWRSFKPKQLGAGTIYQLALDRGWQPDPDLVLNGTIADDDEHPAAAFLARVAAEIAVEQTAEAGPPQPETPDASGGSSGTGSADVARIVTNAPALLGQITRWMVASAVSPQPLLSLGAALCVLGTAMGRRYRLESPDTRSNIYAIALGDSASGKDHPRKCGRRLLIEAGLAQHLGGETLASGSGLLASIVKHPVRLFFIDEFGHFVQAVLDPQSHAHYRREVMTQLTILATSATETVIGTEYANQEERPRQDICEPCVACYGTTVPGTFWDAMRRGTITDGSLPRFLVLQSEVSYPDRQDPDPIENNLPDLAAAIAQVAAGDDSLSSVMAPCVRPHLRMVELDTDAKKLDRALMQKELDLLRAHEGTPFTAIVGRLREHVRRVALIAAVAVDHERPIVTADGYAWAQDLVEHCISTVIDQAQRYVADSAYEAKSKAVLEKIRRAGRWLDWRDLSGLLRSIEVAERKRIVTDLVEGGDLLLKEESTKTKKHQWVKAVPK